MLRTPLTGVRLELEDLTLRDDIPADAKASATALPGRVDRGRERRRRRPRRPDPPGQPGRRCRAAAGRPRHPARPALGRPAGRSQPGAHRRGRGRPRRSPTRPVRSSTSPTCCWPTSCGAAPERCGSSSTASPAATCASTWSARVGRPAGHGSWTGSPRSAPSSSARWPGHRRASRRRHRRPAAPPLTHPAGCDSRHVEPPVLGGVRQNFGPRCDPGLLHGRRGLGTLRSLAYRRRRLHQAQPAPGTPNPARPRHRSAGSTPVDPRHETDGQEWGNHFRGH